jgi:hypothetical protein
MIEDYFTASSILTGAWVGWKPEAGTWLLSLYCTRAVNTPVSILPACFIWTKM